MDGEWDDQLFGVHADYLYLVLGTGPHRSGPRFGYDSPFELFTPSPTRRPAAIRPGISRRAPLNRGLDRGAMLAELFLQLLERTPASLRDHRPHEHE